jgi:anti-sigma B factor antagonist
MACQNSLHPQRERDHAGGRSTDGPLVVHGCEPVGGETPDVSVTVPASPSSSRVTIRRQLGVVVVAMHGDLDVAGSAFLGRMLEDLIVGQGNLAVVVDLSRASAADAASLPVLLRALQQARDHGGTFRVTHPPDLLYQALQLTGAGGVLQTAWRGEGSSAEPPPLVGARPARRSG